MSQLLGRLGLETARVPHVDRHGLIWLSRGNLYVKDGTLRFLAAESRDLQPGDYAIPFQMISFILIGPGGTVSHDALRLLARHGTGIIAVGEDGVRIYTAPPLGPGDATIARRHAEFWADIKKRRQITRRLYAWRMGELLPGENLNVLRGIEGARMREAYKELARRHGVKWKARRYDRDDPGAADLPNQAINHAATAMEAAATIAVTVTGAIPQLGFIHEDPSVAFPLDIADLYRTTVTIPIAFQAAAEAAGNPGLDIERRVRELMGYQLRRKKIIPDMIDKIKALLGDGCDSDS